MFFHPVEQVGEMMEGEATGCNSVVYDGVPGTGAQPLVQPEQAGWKMGRRSLLVIVLALVVGLFVYLGYNSYGARRTGVSGDVFSKDSAILKSKADAAIEAPSVGHEAASPSLAEQTAPITPEPQTNAEATQNSAPATDTISSNPPNGMVFSGTGKYQIYQQGNLTWRINTETGQSCVILATDEEWKKPKVYRAGCGRL
jgi:hypothetical protein